jgi:hypothetical protein
MKLRCGLVFPDQSAFFTAVLVSQIYLTVAHSNLCVSRIINRRPIQARIASECLYGLVSNDLGHPQT